MAPSFTKFVYENPGNGVVKSLLEVDYEARKKYALSKTMTFKIYKCIIISLWLLSMLFELKDITIVFRTAVGLMTICRFVLTCTLTLVGVSFLLKQTSYIGLLMDAVALVFIVEIANILYTQVLRNEIREQCESLNPMTVPMYGVKALNERPALVDMICLAGIMVTTLLVMWFWNDNAVEPLYGALSCACLSEGEKCHEANKFDYDFWYKYWKLDVPDIFRQVDELKKGGGAAASALLQTGQLHIEKHSRAISTVLSHAANRLHL